MYCLYVLHWISGLYSATILHNFCIVAKLHIRMYWSLLCGLMEFLIFGFKGHSNIFLANGIQFKIKGHCLLQNERTPKQPGKNFQVYRVKWVMDMEFFLQCSRKFLLLFQLIYFLSPFRLLGGTFKKKIDISKIPACMQV